MRSNGALAHDLKEKTAHTLEVVKDRVLESSKDAGKRIDHDAHSRPWFYVGIAAAFAAIFGIFLGRQTKR